MGGGSEGFTHSDKEIQCKCEMGCGWVQPLVYTGVCVVTHGRIMKCISW